MGIGAFAATLLQPVPLRFKWFMVLPLIWIGGLLVVAGAVVLQWGAATD